MYRSNAVYATEDQVVVYKYMYARTCVFCAYVYGNTCATALMLVKQDKYFKPTQMPDAQTYQIKKYIYR